MKICVLGSGSKGNSTVIISGGNGLLIDAGFSCKATEERLKYAGFSPSVIKAVIISHEHGDHISGAWRFGMKWKVPVYVNSVLENSKCMPKKEGCLINFYNSGDKINFNGLSVSTFPVLHDAAATVGFRISDGSANLGIATDLGAVTDEVLDMLENVHTLIIESNHDADMLWAGPYPVYLKKRITSGSGHISNKECGQLLQEVWCKDLKTVFLSHLSQTNNKPELAYNTVMRAIKARMDTEQKVLIASQSKPGPVVEL